MLMFPFFTTCGPQHLVCHQPCCAAFQRTDLTENPLPGCWINGCWINNAGAPYVVSHNLHDVQSETF